MFQTHLFRKSKIEFDLFNKSEATSGEATVVECNDWEKEKRKKIENENFYFSLEDGVTRYIFLKYLWQVILIEKLSQFQLCSFKARVH